MIQVNDPVLPKGSLILVTGANGFVASHLIESLLALGYHVRGTTRSAPKLDNLKKRWDGQYPGQFEVAEVPDITVESAYNEAIKGVAGVAHVAANVSLSPKYEEVVNGCVQSTLVALKAAQSTPSVKRFVLTSSAIAVADADSILKKDLRLGEKDFNYKAIEVAKSLPDENPMKGLCVYGASKTEGELAAWKFVNETKPSFHFSAVQPTFCIGEILDPDSQQGSSVSYVRDVFTGKSDMAMKMLPEVDMVPIVDIAALHVGALLLPSVKSQRLFGAAYPTNWNDILALFRKNYPQKTFYGDQSNPRPVYHVIDTDSSLKVLKELGQEGWTSFETAIKQTVASSV